MSDFCRLPNCHAFHQYAILTLVIGPRGPLPLRRMTAHWVVLAAAALTTLLAAGFGAALAVYAAKALPQGVRHDLAVASGTSLAATTDLSAADARTTTAAFRSAVGTALPGVPFALWSATWSPPLGMVGGALPATTAIIPAKSTPLLEAAALGDITRHAVLVDGGWPGAPGGTSPGGTGPGGTGAGGTAQRNVIPAALPATAAALLHVHVGDLLRLQDRDSGKRLAFLVTGLFAERQLPGIAAAYWQLDSVPASGAGSAGGFTTFGPLVVDQAAFGKQLTEFDATWVAQPDMAAFTDTQLSAAAADLAALQDSLANSDLLSGTQLTTQLPAVLAAAGSNLAVARSLLAISGLQLIVLATVALLAAARLLAAQREAETTLLIARGATWWQLTRLTAAEVVPLSAVMALGGAAAGRWLAGLLGGTLHDGGIDLRSASTWLDALGVAAGITVLSVGALLFPVLRSGRAARTRHGRAAVLAGATRAGADLGLIALAVLAGWQLRRYSAVSLTTGSLTTGSANPAAAPASIDPVLALAPALALAGGTVVMLRLLPAAARAADRLAASGRGLTASLAGWQFSRQPLRQGGAALLLVMAVATGTLALAQHQSWRASAADQSADAAGADVRVDLAIPSATAGTGPVSRVAGVRAAMAVSVTLALPANVVALDAASAPRVALLRDDQASVPPQQLFRLLAQNRSTRGQSAQGQSTRGQPGTGFAAVPAIATKAFDDANGTGVGAVIAATIGGISVPVRVVAEAASFPTVSGGELIMDFSTLQVFLAAHQGNPLNISQWWLATSGGQVPAGLAGALPPGATVTSRAALSAAITGDPLSAAPQQALLAMAVAAALLAITGFWVSIAANVRQRRAESALLAALGVGQRSAAAQLFAEKLLLSVPSAVLGLLLGGLVARLLVPAVTLTTSAQVPVPAPATLLDLPLTVTLAAVVAIGPALAAALVVFRRPDPAAQLRAAEAA
jgi:hypothetical protein